MQRSLQRSGLMAEVALGGLSRTAVASLLQETNGEATDMKGLADKIHKATGGNAFFVLETIRELLQTGRLDETPADLPLPATVREAVLRRAARLSPLAQQLLEITAVLSPSLTFPAICETSGRDELQTAEGLEELEAHQILLAERDQFIFHHALARDAIYQNISDWRKRLLHRRAASALLYDAIPDNEQLALISEHYALAGDLVLAVDYYQQAAAAASAVFAFQEAVLNLQQAINLANDLPESTDLLPGLYESLADNLAADGEFLDAEAAYQTALDTTQDSNPLHLAEIERKLAATLPPQQREAEAETAYRAALARLDGAPSSRQLQTTRLNILLDLLNVLYLRMQPEAMALFEEETVALLDEVGTAEQQSRYYSRLCQVALLRSRFLVTEEIIGYVDTSLNYAQESGNKRWLCSMRFNKAFMTLLQGHPDSARDMLPQVLETAEALGDAFVTAQCLAYLAVTDRLLGNSAQVAAWLPQLEDVCRHIGYRVYLGVAQANAAWVHYRAADWQRAQAATMQALQSWEDTAYPFRWQAYWILLALALRDNNLADGAGAARAMLDQKQQKLPDEMDRALAAAIATWDARQESAAREHLQTAVGLAAQHGYL
jgi:predicted ATPase